MSDMIIAIIATLWCAIGALIGFALRDIKDAHFYRHRLTEVPAEIARLRDLIKRNQEAIMAEFDDLKTQVANNKTVIASALALINGIADRITAAGTDKQALADLTASLKSDDDALAAAVTANTPAAT